MLLHRHFVHTAVPVVFILIPFIIDMGNGDEVAGDIVMERGIKKGDIQ